MARPDGSDDDPHRDPGSIALAIPENEVVAGAASEAQRRPQGDVGVEAIVDSYVPPPPGGGLPVLVQIVELIGELFLPRLPPGTASLRGQVPPRQLPKRHLGVDLDQPLLPAWVGTHERINLRDLGEDSEALAGQSAGVGLGAAALIDADPDLLVRLLSQGEQSAIGGLEDTALSPAEQPARRSVTRAVADSIGEADRNVDRDHRGLRLPVAPADDVGGCLEQAQPGASCRVAAPERERGDPTDATTVDPDGERRGHARAPNGDGDGALRNAAASRRAPRLGRGLCRRGPGSRSGPGVPRIGAPTGTREGPAGRVPPCRGWRAGPCSPQAGPASR